LAYSYNSGAGVEQPPVIIESRRDTAAAYFTDANGAAVDASLSEEMNSVISTTSSGELQAEEVASSLVSSVIAQLNGLRQFTSSSRYSITVISELKESKQVLTN